MRILVLTKRQYMGQDLLDDRFGRFRELPLELARLGHTVRGITLSYRNRIEGLFDDVGASGGARVTWDSVNLLSRFRPALKNYTRRARATMKEFQPDIVWTCSDAYHAIFGYWLARKFQSRCVIDLYDNFEAFTASQIPGIRTLFRRSVRETEGVTCFSARLADYVACAYPRSAATAVIENGVRADIFHPQDRTNCRRALGLPENATIIGTAGALDSSRGIDTLFRAFEMLSSTGSQIHLALAGPRKRGLRIPIGSQVHDFDRLPHEKVGAFINALDLAVICYRESALGRHSFPQKAYEIIACQAPLVAAAVGSMNDLLSEYRQCLYEPENASSLTQVIARQLQARTVIGLPAPSWSDSARQLADFFEHVLRENPSPAGHESVGRG
jgi:glycosyltransferase involved in cell wall biosynthesis